MAFGASVFGAGAGAAFAAGGVFAALGFSAASADEKSVGERRAPGSTAINAPKTAKCLTYVALKAVITFAFAAPRVAAKNDRNFKSATLVGRFVPGICAFGNGMLDAASMGACLDKASDHCYPLMTDALVGGDATLRKAALRKAD